MFESDYNLKKIKKITTSGTNINMYVTPRYIDHYVNKEYEKFSIQTVKQILKNGKGFVDIGAHYGYYSLIANQVIKNNKIIAIEPVKENFIILKKNFELNNIKNCNLINAAASDIDGKSNFIISEASDSSGFFGNPQANNKKIIKIDTISVSNLIKNENIGMIKIDVEGYEVPIIKDLLKNIKTKDIDFLIEFNPKCQIQAGFKPEEILIEFHNANYDTYLIIDDINQTKNELKIDQKTDISIYKISDNNKKWSKILNEKACVNLLCIPKNKSKLITFFSHSSQLAGGERSMIELIKELKEKNIFSHVVLPNEGPLQKELENINVPYDIVSLNWWANNNIQTKEEINFKNKISTENLINYLPKLSLINPDLIYSNTMVLPWGAIAANQLNKPHVWHIREYGDLDHLLKFDLGYKETIKFIENNSDLIITNSKSVSEHISKYLNYKKPEVVYNYVEISKKYLEEEIQNPYKDKDSLKVIICGNIQPGKNQLEGIKAVNKLIKKNINVELLILGTIGDNQYLNEILDYIKTNNIENNVAILDFVKNPYPIIKSSDIVLIPSVKEAYGRTAVEGMLLQKVVVASDGGGTKEIIKNGETGFVYKSGSVEELEEILTKLTDKKVQNKISQNGFNSLKEFNSKKEYGYKIANYIKENSEIFKNENMSNFLFNLIKKSLEENKKLQQDLNKISQENIIENEINLENKKIYELEQSLEKIRSAKAFKLWRLYCKITGK